jgi:hypothetical protein
MSLSLRTAPNVVSATFAVHLVVAAQCAEFVETVSADDCAGTFVAYQGDRQSYPPATNSITNIDATSKTPLLDPFFMPDSL